MQVTISSLSVLSFMPSHPLLVGWVVSVIHYIMYEQMDMGYTNNHYYYVLSMYGEAGRGSPALSFSSDASSRREYNQSLANQQQQPPAPLQRAPTCNKQRLSCKPPSDNDQRPCGACTTQKKRSPAETLKEGAKEEDSERRRRRQADDEEIKGGLGERKRVWCCNSACDEKDALKLLSPIVIISCETSYMGRLIQRRQVLSTDLKFNLTFPLCGCWLTTVPAASGLPLLSSVGLSPSPVPDRLSSFDVPESSGGRTFTKLWSRGGRI